MNLEQVARCGRYIGRGELTKHLKGNRLTQRQIIEAKCFECMGGYSDGPYDCQIPHCPLYPLMPYRGKTIALAVQPLAQGGTAGDSDGTISGHPDVPIP